MMGEVLQQNGRRRLEKEYARSVVRYQGGSTHPDLHLKRLRGRWQPRRQLREISDLRIALICMETWESRSLIPGILNHFDAEHIPIVDTCDYNFYSTQQERVLRHFLNADEQSPFDLVLVYATNAQISAATLNAIRSYGPLVAVWCLDDKHSFEDSRPQRTWPGGQLPLIGSASLHLTNARECLRWYDFHGASALHWPEAANPHYGIHPSIDKAIDVSFIGQAYGIRKKFVDSLRRQGITVSCFGPGWENPFVSDDEMFRIFARSKINLGFGYVGYSRRITCLKARDFDIPASGNFYLTTYDNELANCFRVGEEIACYQNETDCAEMIRYYLEQPRLMAKIARAGRERVLCEHTWKDRIHNLAEWSGMATRHEYRQEMIRTSNGEANTAMQGIGVGR